MQQQTIFTLLILAFSSYAWSGESDQPQQLIEQQQYQQALFKIEAQLKINPDNVEAQFLRASALVGLNDLTSAIEAYKQLIKNHPSLAEPQNNLAVLLARNGNFDEAEQILQTALNSHPTYAAAHNNLSNIYKTLAGMAYEKALNLNNGSKTKPPAPELKLVHTLHSLQTVKNNPAPNDAELPAEPAPEKPAQPEKPAYPEKEADISKVEETVMAWGRAWSTQDSEAYLSFYSGAFDPPENLGSTAWANQRKKRLLAPTFIRIKLSQMESAALDNKFVSVSFKQHYTSDRYADTTRKLLLLKNEEGLWRILQESEIK